MFWGVGVVERGWWGGGGGDRGKSFFFFFFLKSDKNQLINTTDQSSVQHYINNVHRHIIHNL